MKTIKEMIVDLAKVGIKDKELAEMTGSTQATICRIRTGVHQDPRYSLGAAILAIWQEKFQEAA